MKKVTLIIPGDSSSSEPLVYPPLGLLYVAAKLESKNYKVQMFDLRGKRAKIEDAPIADFYGFTSTTLQIKDVKKYSDYLRNERNGFTILGGAHATWLPEDVEKDFDMVVRGEGENIAEILEDGRRGVIDLKPIKDINELPYPSRHLLAEEKIVSSKLWAGYGFGEGPKATTIMSSRGCAFNCSFCANLPMPVRYRSPENFVNEIKGIIKEYDCRHFRFLDDNFIQNKKRLEEICSALEPMKISFRCSGRSDLLDDKTCELLRMAGCEEIGFGVEVADDGILKLLNKKETVEDHKKAIETAKKHGLQTKAFFITGLPKETWGTIERNKKFMEEVQPDKWIVNLLTPYPGNDIWENPKKYGVRILEKDFSKYSQLYPAKSVIETDVASNEELEEHFNEFIRFLKSDGWRKN